MLAIVAVLSALVLPVFVRARASGRSSATSAVLHQVYVAAGLYAADRDGRPPVTRTALRAALERDDDPTYPAPYTIPMALGSYGIQLKLLQNRLDPGPDLLTRRYPDLVPLWHPYVMDDYGPETLKLMMEMVPDPANRTFVGPVQLWPAVKGREPCLLYDGHVAPLGRDACLSRLSDNIR